MDLRGIVISSVCFFRFVPGACDIFVSQNTSFVLGIARNALVSGGPFQRNRRIVGPRLRMVLERTSEIVSVTSWRAQTAKPWKPSCSVCSASSCTPRPDRCCSKCPLHLATCRMGWQVTTNASNRQCNCSSSCERSVVKSIYAILSTVMNWPFVPASPPKPLRVV